MGSLGHGNTGSQGHGGMGTGVLWGGEIGTPSRLHFPHSTPTPTPASLQSQNYSPEGYSFRGRWRPRARGRKQREIEGRHCIINSPSPEAPCKYLSQITPFTCSPSHSTVLLRAENHSPPQGPQAPTGSAPIPSLPHLLPLSPCPLYSSNRELLALLPTSSVPCSEPLHWLFPLQNVLSLVSAWVLLLAPSGLCSYITFSVRPS